MTGCAVQLFQQLNAAAGSVQCPMYVQWASEERITCRAAAEAFVASLSDHAVTWDEVRDARHVMIHGRRGPSLVRAIRDWLLQRLHGEPAPSGAPPETALAEAADHRVDTPQWEAESGWQAPLLQHDGGAECGAATWPGEDARVKAGGGGQSLLLRAGDMSSVHLLSVESGACTSDRSSSDSDCNSGGFPAAVPGMCVVGASAVPS